MTNLVDFSVRWRRQANTNQCVRVSLEEAWAPKEVSHTSGGFPGRLPTGGGI